MGGRGMVLRGVRVGGLEGRAEPLLEGRAEQLEGRVELLEGRVELLEERVELLEGRVEQREGRVEQREALVEVRVEQPEALQLAQASASTHLFLSPDHEQRDLYPELPWEGHLTSSQRGAM